MLNFLFWLFAALMSWLFFDLSLQTLIFNNTLLMPYSIIVTAVLLFYPRKVFFSKAFIFTVIFVLRSVELCLKKKLKIRGHIVKLFFSIFYCQKQSRAQWIENKLVRIAWKWKTTTQTCFPTRNAQKTYWLSKVV